MQPGDGGAGRTDGGARGPRRGESEGPALRRPPRGYGDGRGRGTPNEVVYAENKLELLHYEARTDEQYGTPLLVVWSLINRPDILDLQPDRSVVRRLLEAGHDVYMIDWNEPSRLDQHLTMADYVDRYIDNVVDVVRDRSGEDSINVLGYCMGGTLTAIYAARFAEKVRAL